MGENGKTVISGNTGTEMLHGCGELVPAGKLFEHMREKHAPKAKGKGSPNCNN